MKRINGWKIGTVVFGALAAAVIAHDNIPAAHAELPRADEPIAMGACHDQRHMAEAIQKLKDARSSLERAEHNKDGWRVAAIEGVDKAIRETDRGCAMAK